MLVRYITNSGKWKILEMLPRRVELIHVTCLNKASIYNESSHNQFLVAYPKATMVELFHLDN